MGMLGGKRRSLLTDNRGLQELAQQRASYQSADRVQFPYQ